ncbi:hypothetical protein TELCIR_20842 [Teladorsagia circumcincta]|uniref:Uncharacterized protein n=1 Tax=Teladorsagia circumcincta TaxID=45464 RepID=A0A2G9TIL2_TELCI|nr:hypothetical protein TELCIR_20842 [Teladorsagia circumcincta]
MAPLSPRAARSNSPRRFVSRSMITLYGKLIFRFPVFPFSAHFVVSLIRVILTLHIALHISS